MLKGHSFGGKKTDRFKDAVYVFLCLEKKKFCQESYGKPFKHRQHFMSNLCERAKVKPFGFHSNPSPNSINPVQTGLCGCRYSVYLRHQSATITAKYIKSLGLEGVRLALEALSQQEGRILTFKPREVMKEKIFSEQEKAVL